MTEEQKFMKRFYIGIISFLFFFTACNNEKVILSLPLEEVAELMIDVHSAEAALQNVYGIRKDSLAGIYYEQIYEIYKIDSTQFQELMQSLRDNPTLMKEVYDRAIIQVEERSNAGE